MILCVLSRQTKVNMILCVFTRHTNVNMILCVFSSYGNAQVATIDETQIILNCVIIFITSVTKGGTHGVFIILNQFDIHLVCILQSRIKDLIH